MADGTIKHSELITKINALYDELVILKVKPERINLLNLDEDVLAEEFEAVTQQLKTRLILIFFVGLTAICLLWLLNGN